MRQIFQRRSYTLLYLILGWTSFGLEMYNGCKLNVRIANSALFKDDEMLSPIHTELMQRLPFYSDIDLEETASELDAVGIFLRLILLRACDV